jgi:hypothetical protein
MIDNSLFFNYGLIYRNLDITYFNDFFLEVENILPVYLKNISNNVLYENENFILLKSIKEGFYKNYFLIMFYFFYKNYFLLNIYYNYNMCFINIKDKSFKADCYLFDYPYKKNYRYNLVKNRFYFLISRYLADKGQSFYKVDKKRYKKLRNEEEREEYMRLLKKREVTLFLS